MRGTKAKKLRRFARARTRRGAPEVNYDVGSPSRWFFGELTLNPFCVRHVYQNMKKQYRLATSVNRRMPGW